MYNVFCLERSKANFGEKNVLSWTFKEPSRPEQMKEQKFQGQIKLNPLRAFNAFLKLLFLLEPPLQFLTCRSNHKSSLFVALPCQSFYFHKCVQHSLLYLNSTEELFMMFCLLYRDKVLMFDFQVLPLFIFTLCLSKSEDNYVSAVMHEQSLLEAQIPILIQ